MKKRVIFDLDETLGTPILDYERIVGFNIRSGTLTLLKKLIIKYDLILWSVSNRNYVNVALKNDLEIFFKEIYSWNEIQLSWKDIRAINGDYLIDDSQYYKDMAKKEGLDEFYIIIPSFGDKADINDPFLWIRIIEKSLL
jgi:hypothetical protein